MKISRVCAPVSRWTFSVKEIRELIDRYIGPNWADPFAGENSPAEITNDIEERGQKYRMDALDFLKSLGNQSVDGVLFDPPYSVEQCLRKYTLKYGGTAGVVMYWALCKDEIARITKLGGCVISFNWDSTGMGSRRGFEIEEVKLICHSGAHRDTIITVDRKISHQEILFPQVDPKEEVKG